MYGHPLSLLLFSYACVSATNDPVQDTPCAVSPFFLVAFSSPLSDGIASLCRSREDFSTVTLSPSSLLFPGDS